MATYVDALIAYSGVVGSVVTGIFSGENAETKRLKDSNEELKTLITNLQEQIQVLSNSSVADRDGYDAIRAYFETHHYDLRYKPNTIAVIGPKGSGKSTLLWKYGIATKPSKSVSNGTVELTSYGSFIDTIGINIEIDQMIKLLAVLISKEQVPDTLVLCCNDRFDRSLVILSHLLITRFYISIIDTKRVYREGFKPDCFDEEAYEVLATLNRNVEPIRSHTEIQSNMHSLVQTCMLLFPSGQVVLPVWNDHCTSIRSGDSAVLVAYEVAKAIYVLNTKFKGRALPFLDSR